MVAAAVEEQSAATQEIARNAEQAAHGTVDVATKVSSVSDMAIQTEESLNDVNDAINALNDLTTGLESEMIKFVENIK